MKPTAQPVTQPSPVQSTPLLPQENKVKPPVKPKPPPVMSKPVLSGHLSSKTKPVKSPPSTLSTHSAKGLEVTPLPLPPHSVPPAQHARSDPPSASTPQGKTDAPTEHDLLYDRLSDYWDIPQKVAAEAEGTMNSQTTASQSPTPKAAVMAQSSQPPTSTAVQQAATGSLQEEADPVLRPYQKTGFYNSLSSISPSPSPTPSLLMGNNSVPATPPYNLPSWTTMGVSQSSQEQSKASAASQSKPTAARESANEAADGNRSKQPSHSTAVAQSQSSSSSPSSSSTKETQSVFLRKMLASSDQSIVPHHMLMVGEASKGRVASTTTARQVPAEEPSPTSIDTELEDLINELEDEAAAILRSQQAAATDAVQDCG